MNALTDAPDDTAALSQRLGLRVRSARAARAMTMKQLATDSGISLPYLSRVVRGDGNVSIAVLHRLARALNVSTDALLSDHERFGADYALIVEMLKRQSPDSLRNIRSWLVNHLDQQSSQQGGVRRIALIGLRGAGKSTLGPALAQQLGTPFVELNAQVAQMAGMSLNEVFSIYGQAGYRRLERQCLEVVIAGHPQVVLATGGGIVAEPATYEVLLHSFYTVWLHARPEEHFRRVMAQHDARIATPQLRDEAMANIVSALAARSALYALAHAAIDTTGLTTQAVLARALALIDEHHFSFDKGVAS